MIQSAEEFIALRNSEIHAEYNRASTEFADIAVWQEIIEKHPNMKIWVIHNKTIPIEILEQLVTDVDVDVRKAIASKRKINEKIFTLLAKDKSKEVKYALICNTKLKATQLQKINVADSDWLKEKLEERINSK